MDIVGGLSAAKLAVALVKDLREIDRSVDEATYKLKLADLTTALADAQVALSEAKIQLNEKDIRIAGLVDELESERAGEKCPKCLTGRLKLIDSRPMTYGGLGVYGVEDQNYSCGEATCDYKTKRCYDPQGLISKNVGKQ